MTETWPDQLAEGFRRLAMPAEPQVWQLASDAEHERSSFFFAWCLANRRDRPVVDRDSRLARHVQASWRRSATLGSTRDVASVLAVEKQTCDTREFASDIDDIDDSMLRVSRTALFDRSRRESDPGRYVDPFETPFVVLSTRRTFWAMGVELGDFATAMNPRTGRIAHAIVGDDREVPGAEPSPALAECLDLTAFDRAIYLVHPGTGQGQGTIPTHQDIRREGERLFRTPAWSVILAEFVGRLDARG